MTEEVILLLGTDKTKIHVLVLVGGQTSHKLNHQEKWEKKEFTNEPV